MFAMIFISVCMVGILFSVMMLFRNNWTAKCRSHALNRVDYWSKKLISDVIEFDPQNESGKMSRWGEFFQILASYPEYGEMMWDLQNWGYDYLYPDLEQRLSDAYDMIMVGVPSYDELQKEFGDG